MKILLVFSYDGSKFHGFQRQNTVRNVQGELEEALSKIYGEKIVIKGAGRTDAGVHALNQAAHFEVNTEVSNLKKKLNNSLTDITINIVKKVKGDFHARYSPKYKVYEYRICYDVKGDSNYYLVDTRKLNLKIIRETAKKFIGTHDFRNFVSGYRDDYVTTIFNIKVIKLKSGVCIRFTGKGFYRYMVRNLVGALLDVSKGKVLVSDVKNMLDTDIDLKRLSTAPANGLYLVKIKY